MKEIQFILYNLPDDEGKVQAVIKDETIWLTQKAMAAFFDVGVPAISKHLNNIYEEGELSKEATVSKMEIVRKEGNRNVNRELEFYNLDAIIAVGYRVNSKKATKFRIWATKILKDYMIKGFVIDVDKMKNGPKFGKDYYDELLQTIKEIRLSERRQYQKITDVFETTSVDYNKDSEEAYTFFKIVQNKLHYAITGKTAAELIFERVDSGKIHMGLTNWKNSPDGKIMKYDISIAKNYLKKDELNKLNDLTNLFLDVAESEAKEQKVMTMKDWIEVADDLLRYRKKKVLNDSGKISHKKALEKAENEYEKFRVKQDQEYISSMDEMYKKYLEENKK